MVSCVSFKCFSMLDCTMTVVPVPGKEDFKS